MPLVITFLSLGEMFCHSYVDEICGVSLTEALHSTIFTFPNFTVRNLECF